MDIAQQIFKEVNVIQADVKKLIDDVAGLKVKAGIWGFFGGLTVAIPVIFAVYRMIQ